MTYCCWCCCTPWCVLAECGGAGDWQRARGGRESMWRARTGSLACARCARARVSSFPAPRGHPTTTKPRLQRGGGERPAARRECRVEDASRALCCRTMAAPPPSGLDVGGAPPPRTVAEERARIFVSTTLKTALLVALPATATIQQLQGAGGGAGRRMHGACTRRRRALTAPRHRCAATATPHPPPTLPPCSRDRAPPPADAPRRGRRARGVRVGAAREGRLAPPCQERDVVSRLPRGPRVW